MLIGITGKKRAGKDEAARYLTENHRFERVAFADPLKELALSINPWVGGRYAAQMELLSSAVDRLGWEGAKEYPDVRGFLQRLGVGLRDVMPNFWVDLAMAQIDDLMSQGLDVVVTDIRFDNEASLIHEFDGTVVEIRRQMEGPLDPHISEAGINPRLVDDIIYNKGSIRDLHQTIQAVFLDNR